MDEETIKKRRLMHEVLQNYPDEFASGHTISYEHNGVSKLGLCMRYIRGGTLQERLGKIIHEMQLLYALQLAQKLDHLHALGYLHRDIKAANILVSEDSSQVFIADFDLTVRKDSKEAQEFAGNFQHMAPEMFALWVKASLKECFGEEKTAISLQELQRVAPWLYHDNFRQLPDDAQADLVEGYKKIAGNVISEKSEVFSLGMLLYAMKHGKYCKSWPKNPADYQDPYEQVLMRCISLNPKERPSLQEVVLKLRSL